MHIYVFGSLCRGEVTLDSDVDLLAVTNGFDDRLNKNIFSIYSYSRIQEIWKEGNPFAWHLYSEAKLLYALDKIDFLKSLGQPNNYSKGVEDCRKFYLLYKDSIDAIGMYGANVFEFSNIFLALRNIATCFSLFSYQKMNFSRNSALLLDDESIKISNDTYNILERSRILSVRGIGETITHNEFVTVAEELHVITAWIESLLYKVESYGGV